MSESRYQWVVDIRRGDGGGLLLQAPVKPNWASVLEWAHFDAVRGAELPPLMADGVGHVEPIWDGELGEPYVWALRVVIPAKGVRVTREIPRSYLHPVAQAAAQVLVTQKVLEPGEVFRYVVTAFRDDAAPPSAAADAVHGVETAEDLDFTVEPLSQPLPLHEDSLAAMRERSTSTGNEAPGEVPVFFPQLVLDSAIAQARAAGDVESGGILIGRLCRDPSQLEIFVVVTGYIPAEHGLAQTTRFTFTAATWAAARDALALRRRGEIVLGWSHHHPSFCRLRGCPVERRQSCSAATPFLSQEDLHLHAACFSRAHHLALLVTELANPKTFHCTLYGWSRGMIAERGFHVLADGA